MINKLLLTVIFVVVAIVPLDILFAQTDCPPDRNDDVFKTKEINTGLNFYSMSLVVQANYSEHKTGDYSWDIVLDNSTATLNNQFVSSYTANKLAMMEIALSKAVPDVETDVTFAYPTECKVNLRTALRVDKEQRIYCCENPNIDPGIYEYNGQLLSDYWTTNIILML